MLFKLHQYEILISLGCSCNHCFFKKKYDFDQVEVPVGNACPYFNVYVRYMNLV